MLAPACLGRHVFFFSPLSCVHASFAFPPSSATVPSCVALPSVHAFVPFICVPIYSGFTGSASKTCSRCLLSQNIFSCIMPILQTCCCQISGGVMWAVHWPLYLNGQIGPGGNHSAQSKTTSALRRQWLGGCNRGPAAAKDTCATCSRCLAASSVPFPCLCPSSAQACSVMLVLQPFCSFDRARLPAVLPRQRYGRSRCQSGEVGGLQPNKRASLG